MDDRSAEDGRYNNCDTLFERIVLWNLTIYLLICVIAAISNALLLYAMYKNPLKCFRNPTSYFIANLAVVDFLTSIAYIAELLITQTTYRSFLCFPGAWKYIHTVIVNFLYDLIFPSVTILALERYVSIAHPMWHRVKVTSRLCCTGIVVVWVATCIFTAIDDTILPAEIVTVHPSVFYLTTVVIYFLAFISIRKQHSSLLTDDTRSQSARKVLEVRLKNQNRFLTTVLIINIVLIFGIIPSIISTHFRYTLEQPFSTSTEVWISITDILFFLNAAVNPFLYIWRLPKYRKTFFVMYSFKTL